jgi:type VI secretion system secreted protein VgrG
MGSGGFNEIRFEDKKGSEQIFIHGQKDSDIRIENDSREWIGRDRHLIVKRDKYDEVDRDIHIDIKRDHKEKIEGDRNLTVQGKEAVQVKGSQSLQVTGNVAEQFSGNHTEQTTGSYFLQTQSGVLTGQQSICLMVGGNFISIGPAGVTLVGTLVLINSGGAPIPGIPGMVVSPAAPGKAMEADQAVAGSEVRYSADGGPSSAGGGGAAAPSPALSPDAPWHNPAALENQDKKHYIAIKLRDETGKPVAGEPYEIVLPDGTTVASGTTDEQGGARVDYIDPGQCHVRFRRGSSRQ